MRKVQGLTGGNKGVEKPAWSPLVRATFESKATHYDQLVLKTPGIDYFCSSSFWILAAADALHDQAELRLWQSPQGYACLARHESPLWGQILMPLEASWCLACPIVSDQPEVFAATMASEMDKDPSWDSLFLSGLTMNGRLWNALVGAFPNYRLYIANSAVRCQASLTGGRDHFLARRSQKFRKNMRRSDRSARREGIRLVQHHHRDGVGVRAFFERAMNLEALSWKGLSGQGVNQGQMRQFYAEMLPRLAERGCFRAVTAQIGEQWVGFAFGGVWGEVFRGLQFSFLPEWQHLSLGNLMQMELITGLSEEGLKIYDLGMDMAYKRRWSDQLMTTHALLIKR